jgi:hypothetical protein
MQNDKLVVGHDPKTGFYTFKTGYNNSMEINGKPVADPLLGFRSGELIVTKEKPITATYKTSGRVTVGYAKENGERISVIDYNTELHEIGKTRRWNDDLEDFEYDTLEDEVRAIRFIKTYSGVYETQETVHNLELEFVTYPVSEYKCIVPMQAFNASDISETKCKLVMSKPTLLYDACSEFGIDKSRIDIPNHNGLTYAKIDDKYIYGIEVFEKSNFSFIGTYEECIERMNGIKKCLSDILSIHLAKQSQKVLDKGTLGHLMNELVGLERNISSLDVKKSDYNSWRAIKTSLLSLIEAYKKLK